MSSIQWSELEQEAYDPEEFVERLAWRVLGQHQTPSNPFEETKEEFDAEQLNEAFIQAIKDLNHMHEKQKKEMSTFGTEMSRGGRRPSEKHGWPYRKEP